MIQLQIPQIKQQVQQALRRIFAPAPKTGPEDGWGNVVDRDVFRPAYGVLGVWVGTAVGIALIGVVMSGGGPIELAAKLLTGIAPGADFDTKFAALGIAIYIGLAVVVSMTAVSSEASSEDVFMALDDLGEQVAEIQESVNVMQYDQDAMAGKIDALHAKFGAD